MILGRIVLSSASLFLFLIIASIYIIGFYQNPPIVILNDPVPTDKQQYKPGDRVVIAVEAEIRSQSPSTLFITWRGETPQPIPVAEIKIGGLPLGRVERTFPIAVVPQVLIPGRYVLELESVYTLSVFPVEREVEWRSTEFEVVREGSTSTVPITAYLFLADQSGESPVDLANEMPRLEASATVIATPEASAVPSLPAVPAATSIPIAPTVEPPVQAPPATPVIPTVTPSPKPVDVPVIVPRLPAPPIDLPPIDLPPIDPPPIFIPPIPPIPPIDVPPIDVPPVIIPPLPHILP